jgi:predicted transcriptional regulator
MTNFLKDIYIGTIIEQKFLETPMTVQEFADKINCDRTTVYDIFKRKSIDSEKLIRISQVLNFDFVNEIYYKQTPIPQKSQSVKITIETDIETFKELNLPEILMKLVKVEE